METIALFRDAHLENANIYITQKTKNPTGTGGTNFIPWLSKLSQETRDRKVAM